MALNLGKRSAKEADSYANRCLTKIKKAAEWRKDAKYDETWSNCIQMYANTYKYEELDDYDDVVAPNMAFSTVNILVPAIAVNHPKITVTARKEAQALQAETVEAVANYEWRRNDVQSEIRAATKDFTIIGHGWLKTTWNYVVEQQPYTPEEWQNEVDRALAEAQAAIEQSQQNGFDPAEFPTPEDVRKSIPKQRAVVTQDAPTVARISPYDMLVDPNATSLSNATWIAERLFVPMEVARQNGKWNEKARRSIKGVAMSEAKKDVEILREGEQRTEDADFAVVYEFYDLIKGTVCTIAEGCEDYLRDPEPIPYTFGHPYVMLRNYDVPDKLYPLGDVEVMYPLQLELAMTRTQMANDRKRYRRAYMYRSGAIGAKGVEDLISGIDNVMIDVEDNVPFADVIAPIQTTSLPPEFYNQSGMIQGDIDLVTGVTEYQRGALSEVRRSATEAGIIQDGANARTSDKLATIELAIAKVAERVVALMQQFLTTEQVAKVVGEDAQLTWITYTRDDIAGEYDFIVEAGSTQPQNESFRRQSAMQMMDAMTPFVQMGVVDPHALAEYVLKNGFGVKDTQRFMAPPPPMMPGAPMGAPPVGAPAGPVAPGGVG